MLHWSLCLQVGASGQRLLGGWFVGTVTSSSVVYIIPCRTKLRTDVVSPSDIVPQPLQPCWRTGAPEDMADILVRASNLSDHVLRVQSSQCGQGLHILEAGLERLLPIKRFEDALGL